MDMNNIPKAIGGWIKNVVGEGFASKKTLGTIGAIVTIIGVVAKLAGAVNTIPMAIICSVGLVCATICFIYWIKAQAQNDSDRIQKGIKK